MDSNNKPWDIKTVEIYIDQEQSELLRINLIGKKRMAYEHRYKNIIVAIIVAAVKSGV